MTIKDFFEKDISRTIETVIKADDRTNVATEVAEYVITNEISNKIQDFFRSYNQYDGANGVWVSGFFGSGKSHLLKILSYVLENKAVDGDQTAELFARKIKSDALLRADVLAAARIPAESILFNIDQQAQITSKTDANAILAVFYKVFYDHLGYYGFQPHVAEFEMWLDKQGKYELFKSNFETVFGNSWLEVRGDYFDPKVTDAIARVLGEAFHMAPEKYELILDEIEDKHKQSIEDFCQRVQDYIRTKPRNFRLNFFVDEIGQYISDNTKLMLNLQTIAETLATVTKGNAWIMVTSQEDMEKVLGDWTKSQENDFSRIQARFKIKIPLTSANVDEVIEKRLLKKTAAAEQLLIANFTRDHALLDTLLSFSEVGVQFRGYRDEQDFAAKYPFVPYQFDLFQQCRIALSTHNAFQGRHASVGERSMLSVFQQVAKRIEDKNEQALISFDLMFDGIRSELKGQIQNSLILAEKQLHQAFAIKVLKALFLVKYFSHFKATKRNIAVLMIDRIDIDLVKHETMVGEALNLLESQSYVQRNGEHYEFLTDDEKDIEEEIKNTPVDDPAITQMLKEIFFDELIRDNKIRYLENKQEYELGSRVNGTSYGREKELEIEIITETDDLYAHETFHQSQTMGTSLMRLVLPAEANLMKDVRMYMRTDKYTKQNLSMASRPEVRRILQEKNMQNSERRRNIILLANRALAGATVYMNGAKPELGAASDGKALVINAFQSLIKTVYPNLRMLGTAQFTEDSFRQVIRGVMDQLFRSDDNTMSEAEAEVLMVINRRKKQSDRSTLNDLRAHFSKKPYGWYPNALWTMIARLYKRGKLEIKRNGNVLDDEEVLASLLNTNHHSVTLLELQTDIPPQLVRKLKEIYAEAFDETCAFNDAREVGNAFKAKLKELYHELNALLARQSTLPFLGSLQHFANEVQQWSSHDYTYFLTQAADFEDQLLDAKEQLLDPIKKFINGDQVNIYESVKMMVQGDTSNLDYVDGNEFQTLKDLLDHPQPYKGNLIRDAKAAQDELRVKLSTLIEAEKADALSVIGRALADLKGNEEYQGLTAEQQTKIALPFEEELQKLHNQRFIAVIRDIRRRAVEILLPRQLNEMLRLAQPSGEGELSEPRVHYIRSTSVNVEFDRSELRTESDVDAYISALRKALLAQIKETRRITL